MFGVLNKKVLNTEEYSNFRINYCSTCKSIGKLYGNKNRILLNYDVVFLEELLSNLTNNSNYFKNFSAYKCQQLPKSVYDIPMSLQYVSSINVILSYFKLLDNYYDSKNAGKIKWGVLIRIQKSSFKKAKIRLKELGFPFETISKNIKQQFLIEKEKNFDIDFKEIIKKYSLPTANLTASIFSYGSNFTNPELANNLYNIGFAFGEIVYLNDALTDYETDRRNNQFNILNLNLGCFKNKKESIKCYIRDRLEILKREIDCLPLNTKLIHSYKNRLDLNLSVKDNIINETPNRISIDNKLKIIKSIAHKVSRRKSLRLFRLFSYSIIVLFLTLGAIFFPNKIFASKQIILTNGICCNCYDSCSDNEKDCCWSSLKFMCGLSLCNCIGSALNLPCCQEGEEFTVCENCDNNTNKTKVIIIEREKPCNC